MMLCLYPRSSANMNSTRCDGAASLGSVADVSLTTMRKWRKSLPVVSTFNYEKGAKPRKSKSELMVSQCCGILGQSIHMFSKKKKIIYILGLLPLIFLSLFSVKQYYVCVLSHLQSQLFEKCGILGRAISSLLPGKI